MYNSNSNINVIVRDASICNINTTGVFTFLDSDTDGKNSTLLSTSTWSSSSSGSYTQTDESTSKYNATAVGDAEQVGEDWILIPQTLTYATTYDNTQSAPFPFAGACIKINLKIKNNATGTPGAYIVGADDDPLDDDDNGGYITEIYTYGFGNG